MVTRLVTSVCNINKSTETTELRDGVNEIAICLCFFFLNAHFHATPFPYLFQACLFMGI